MALCAAHDWVADQAHGLRAQLAEVQEACAKENEVKQQAGVALAEAISA